MRWMQEKIKLETYLHVLEKPFNQGVTETIRGDRGKEGQGAQTIHEEGDWKSWSCGSS